MENTKKLKTLAEIIVSGMAITARPITCLNRFDNPPLLGEKDLANEEVRGLESESEFEDLIFEAYLKEIDESEGFDVGDYRGKLPGLCGMIAPVAYSKEKLAEEFNGHAESAIKLYNKKMDAKFKLVEVEKANFSYMTYHITFTSREDENDEPIVFQALVGNRIKGATVTFCRQKGKPNEGYMKGDEDCSEVEEEKMKTALKLKKKKKKKKKKTALKM